MPSLGCLVGVDDLYRELGLSESDVVQCRPQHAGRVLGPGRSQDRPASDSRWGSTQQVRPGHPCPGLLRAQPLSDVEDADDVDDVDDVVELVGGAVQEVTSGSA